MVVKRLYEMGVRAEHAYVAGTASIGMAILSWVMSRKLEQRGIERADRWGIFVGEWAPTFFALGNALRLQELPQLQQQEQQQQAEMPTTAGTTPR